MQKPGKPHVMKIYYARKGRLFFRKLFININDCQRQGDDGSKVSKHLGSLIIAFYGYVFLFGHLLEIPFKDTE